jgi:hypothetical protein
VRIKPFTLLIIAAGFVLVGLAVFANQVGIDHNAVWGTKRYILLFAGLGLLLGGILFSFFGDQITPARDQSLSSSNKDGQKTNPDDQYFVLSAGLKNQSLLVLPVVVFVVIIYIWYASVGLWTTWPGRTTYYPLGYYTLLARAFQNHQLYLEVKPSEKLLALPDPYDPAQRRGVGEPLDFSLYQGKFYLYWGPVPAALLAALKPQIPKAYPDLHLVFAFTLGLFLLQVILVSAIWERYFSNLPKWILVMALLLVGLAGPTLWILGTGGIYEASIMGGQFFLMAGFLAVLSALFGSSLPDLKLICAGVLWALAIGTRLSLIVPIGFMVLMTGYSFWKKNKLSFSGLIQKAFYLGLPIVIGLMLLGWYNWARFGSFTETGFTYQLAGTHIQKHLDDVMSFGYVIQNIYNYFLPPPRLVEHFPYLFSNGGSIYSFLAFYKVPEFYNTNAITGLIYVCPFVIFSFFNIGITKKENSTLPRVEKKDSPLAWIIITLTGSTMIVLVFLLLFFWAAMRYVADFLPMLLVVSIIGYARAYSLAKEKGGVWRLIVALGVFLAVLSIVISAMLGVGENLPAFQEHNPALLAWFDALAK